MRQLLGAVAEFQRSDLVTRLRVAREAWLQGSKERHCGESPSLAGNPTAYKAPKARLSRRSCRKKYIKKAELEKGDVEQLRQELYVNGVCTEIGDWMFCQWPVMMAFQKLRMA